MPCVVVSVCPPITIQASTFVSGAVAGTPRSCATTARQIIITSIAGRAPAPSLITAACPALGAARYALEPT